MIQINNTFQTKRQRGKDLLADPEWVDMLTAEDRRELTPLFWSHVLPYGEVKLNMDTHLHLSAAGG